jgi:hypothetical protein
MQAQTIKLGPWAVEGALARINSLVRAVAGLATRGGSRAEVGPKGA